MPLTGPTRRLSWCTPKSLWRFLDSWTSLAKPRGRIYPPDRMLPGA